MDQSNLKCTMDKSIDTEEANAEAFFKTLSHESGTPFKTGGGNPKTPLFIFSSTFINSFLLIFFIITNRYERCFKDKNSLFENRSTEKQSCVATGDESQHIVLQRCYSKSQTASDN